MDQSPLVPCTPLPYLAGRSGQDFDRVAVDDFVLTPDTRRFDPENVLRLNHNIPPG